MLRSLKALEHYVVFARNGEVARVRNFLIDDVSWSVRHLVLSSGHFFAGSDLLLSPRAVKSADWAKRRLHVAWTAEQIKQCPSIDVDPPVALQHSRGGPYDDEPYYWGFLGLWAQEPYPGLLGQLQAAAPQGEQRANDPHLRSARELQGYAVTHDGQRLGHVEDFMIDDETWQVRYVVVEARAAVFSEKMLLAVERISGVSWTQKVVLVQEPVALEEEEPGLSASFPGFPAPGAGESYAMNADQESRADDGSALRAVR